MFLAKSPLYFEDNGRLFVHGGFDIDRGVKDTPHEVFLWDRGLYESALQLHNSSPEWQFGDYVEIFIGHTPVTKFAKTPRHFCNVWAIDTGAGGCFEGPLRP